MKIYLGFLLSSGRQLRDPIELNPDQSALVPREGDYIAGEIFSVQYRVESRTFGFNQGAIHITLNCTT